MAFSDIYQLRRDQGGIYVFRGRFRDKDWWEPVFVGSDIEIQMVYKLLEAVYNTGEHDGRKFVRDNIKSALALD